MHMWTGQFQCTCSTQDGSGGPVVWSIMEKYIFLSMHSVWGSGKATDVKEWRDV